MIDRGCFWSVHLPLFHIHNFTFTVFYVQKNGEEVKTTQANLSFLICNKDGQKINK